ncbi:MAG: nucleotidyl transferase AbiEii/AbiGii toxin family protein [Bacillota bacterium]|nr:nucleotidyl transferase AbiEii/AbiGii toxin family protein [Bacillota bacterium]
MKITAEEKLMYEVMQAIYDSGIPISFKGSMVLKACLMEAGFSEDTRHTVDIDANWNSDTPPSGEQMVESLQSALKKNGLDLDVSLYRMYGEGRSAGFELAERGPGEILFSMDIDVNRPAPQTKIYEVEGLRFCGVSPSQMIADKVSAVSSDKVFRRVKDVVDLYYISKVFDFDKTEVMRTLSDSGRSLNTFNGFLHRADELRHAYEKFRFAGDMNKPPFDEVYRAVKSYLKGVIPKEKLI